MGGMEDEDVTRDDLDEWREVTSGRFRLRMFAGGHFFIQEHQATLIAAVAQELMPLVPGR
jgi:surfactin synthase thioesterase subunit